MMRNTNSLSNEKKWFIQIASFTITLIIFYIGSHIAWPGEELVGFSETEIDFILNVKSDTSTTDAVQLDIINQFLSSSGKIEGFTMAFAQCGLAYERLPLRELKTFLQNIRITQKSIFWLNSEQALLEVVFWSLFGVLCSLLFHGTEAIRLGAFDPKEQSVHWGKLIYSPIITVIIIFSSDVLLSEGDINLDGFSYWIIVWSFILGFYSRRAIDLLDRVKDLVFRSSPAKEDNVTAESTDTTQKSDSDYSKLPEKEQHRLVTEWMTHKSEEFEMKYGLSGIRTGFKTKNGVTTKTYGIIFEVPQKSNSSLLLPKIISYKGYEIPTDVDESPITEGTSTALSLASSISRKGISGFGTLGIKVLKGNQELIMSCYHVLFPEELLKGQRLTDKSSIIGDPSIQYPKKGNDIGKVEEGQLDSWIDVGFIEVDSSILIQDEWESQIGPYGKRYLEFEDEQNKTYVQYWGAGSNKLVSRRVKSVFSNQPIEYHNGKIKQTIKGLVVLDGPAQGGDSGAPVFDPAGNFVGMIIASNKLNAYMITLSTIENRTSIKIKC